MKSWRNHSLITAAALIAMAAMALPAGAQITVLTADRFISLHAHVQGGSDTSFPSSSSSPGTFIVGPASVLSQDPVPNHSVVVTASQNSTTPNVTGSTISGTGDAKAFIEPGSTAIAANAKSVLNVTFNADVNADFSLSGTLDTPSTDFFASPAFKIEDLTDGTPLIDVSGPQALSLIGSLTQGHHYRVFASSTANGDLQSNSGRTELKAEASWDFNFTAREAPAAQVPEPGVMALLTGCCVAGVLAWRRRRV